MTYDHDASASAPQTVETPQTVDVPQSTKTKRLFEKCHSEERSDEESLCYTHIPERCFAALNMTSAKRATFQTASKGA